MVPSPWSKIVPLLDEITQFQGSSSLKDIPVVIMSSENVPARINRSAQTPLIAFFLVAKKLVRGAEVVVVVPDENDWNFGRCLVLNS